MHVALLAALAGLLAACASYERRPLVPEQELAALRAVDLAELRIQHARPGVEMEPGDLAFDPTDGLDEPELVAVVLTLNAELRAKRFEIGEKQALLISAGAWPNPEIDLSLRSVIDGSSALSIGFDLLFEMLRADERPAKEAVAEKGIELARAEIAASELELVSKAREARLRILAAEEVARLLEQETDLRAKAVALVRQQRELGEATEIAVALAGIEHASLARRLRDARGTIDVERRALNALAGLPPDYELHLAGLGRSLTFTIYDDLDDDELDRRLLAGSFELRVRALAYDRAEEELRLAIARQGPKWKIGPSYEKDDEGSQSLGIGGSLELPIFDRNEGEIAEKTASRERRRAEYAAALQAARARAFGARAKLRRARADVELEQRELVPLIERTEALFESALRARELTIFEWLTALGHSLQARRDVLDGLVRYAGAVTELEAATGMPLAASADAHAGNDGRIGDARR